MKVDIGSDGDFLLLEFTELAEMNYDHLCFVGTFKSLEDAEAEGSSFVESLAEYPACAWYSIYKRVGVDL